MCTRFDIRGRGTVRRNGDASRQSCSAGCPDACGEQRWQYTSDRISGNAGSTPAVPIAYPAANRDAAYSLPKPGSPRAGLLTHDPLAATPTAALPGLRSLSHRAGLSFDTTRLYPPAQVQRNADGDVFERRARLTDLFEPLEDGIDWYPALVCAALVAGIVGALLVGGVR